jgi:transposase
MREKHNKVTFKPYNMNQLQLPMSLDDLIPDDHLVRVVNNAIDQMNIESLLKKYKGGGTSAYHPKMMLKVLVYAYTEKTYTSRRIAKALRENINFMWIAGGNKPDYRTINRFRSSVMNDTINDIFASVVELLLETKMIKLENYFLDGTIVEANANKYSYVWKKNTKRYKQNVQTKIKLLLEQIDELNNEENRRYGDTDLEELGVNSTITADRIAQTVKEIDKKLAQKENNVTVKKKLNLIKNEYLPRLQKYEEQEDLLKERNSYSKTDHDATFMRMKDAPLGKTNLKPAYNIQLGTENQFIIGYSVHQKTSDTSFLIPHFEILKKYLPYMPENIVADAGYGSEENYEYLEEQKLLPYVKYNYFQKEKTPKFKEQIFRVENLVYDEKTDEFICPAGKRLKHTRQYTEKTANNYPITIDEYACSYCNKCKLRSKCTKSKGNRKIEVSHRSRALRNKAREYLESEKGLDLRSKRGVEVESVFGHIKANRGLRRFLLRGIDKVNIEWGLACIAHNMIKVAAF